MGSDKKGEHIVFRYESEHGVDKGSGLVHSMVVMAANIRDQTPDTGFLNVEEDVLYADAG